MTQPPGPGSQLYPTGTPVQPAPIDQAPIQPAPDQPALNQPALNQPGPDQPAPNQPAPVPPAPPDGQWQPARIDPVPGTGYGMVQLHVAPATSGQAIGSLIAGIGSILVSVLVLCFGVAGAADGWGGWVAGAFALLSVLIGGGAMALGLIATRQIRRSGRDGRLRFTGRGTAIAGISCGAAGVGIALLSLVLSLVLQIS